MSTDSYKINIYNNNVIAPSKISSNFKHYCQLQKARQRFNKNNKIFSKSQENSIYYQDTTPNITKKLHTNYYKDPFFLNENNLNLQLKFLKSLDSVILDDSITQIPTSQNEIKKLLKVNLRVKNLSNLSQKERNRRFNNMVFYKTVFKCKSLFKKPKSIVVDNKLNMKYAENEQQYKQIIDKENKKLKSLGKPIKKQNNSFLVDSKINEAKNKIQFMKGIVDYSYPNFVLKKIKIMEGKHVKNLSDNFFSALSPVEERNKERNIRNGLRQKYLMNSFQFLKK